MATKRKSNKKVSITLAIIFIVLAVAGYFVYTKFFKKDEKIAPKGDISFHFMMLGNGNSGDSIYVRAGENDILIDAGSRKGSIPTIQKYLNKYVTDNTLEYVIVTHAHEDHYAGFAKRNGSLFDLYECETIIDFPLTNHQTRPMYQDYVAERTDEIKNGATHYTALQCYKEQDGAKRVYDLSGDGNVTMEILYNYYYEHTFDNDENNYSVCVQFSHGSENKFLFTGDLEKVGEDSLIKYNDLSKVKLYKAGHHGSKTSSSTDFLKVIQPEICVISCAIGDSYDFPKQDFINRIAPYTSQIYVTTMANPDYTNGADYTQMNGDVVVISSEEGVFVECSGNDTILKNSKWFLDNRTWPANGK